MRIDACLLGAVMLLGCAAEAPAPGPSPSSLTTPLPAQPDPRNPYRFPAQRPIVRVEPQTVCPDQMVLMSGSRLPAAAVIEIWLGGVTAGGWKIGNPPHPSTMSAFQLGTVSTNAAGEFQFPFTLTTAIVKALGNSSNGIAVWLVYPKDGTQTPVQPDAAIFTVCH